MDFISNKAPQIQEMLATIGVGSIDELFCGIPDSLKLSAPSQDDGMSEFEGMRLMEEIATKNTYPHFENYLGAGAYQHHIPAIVSAVCSKSEFLTAYTPYQAEASQGMLQMIFEFQSAICALTGMEVSNASLYDGASACAEALLMSLRLQKGRNKVLIARSVHPYYAQVAEQYLNSHQTEISYIPFQSNGQIDLNEFSRLLDDKTAAVLFQSPNFLGTIEEMPFLAHKARESGALSILCANPLAYGLYESARLLGVDIAVGDTQPFGLPLQFGGPYVGYIACRQDLVRQMPGRLIGETVDTKGRRGFVLTMQAREQHIRREKATSNICTNQALAALASLVTILWYGKEGIRKLALTNYQRASYLKRGLETLPSVRTLGKAPIFNEFAVDFGTDPERIKTHYRKNGAEPGLDLGRFYPNLKGYFLVAVTETKDKAQLDRYIKLASALHLGLL